MSTAPGPTAGPDEPRNPWVREHYGFPDAEPEPRRHGTAGSGRRTGAWLLALATVAGLVLGLAGPSTSPVTPGAQPVAVLSGLADRFQGTPGVDGRDGPRGRR